MTASRQSLAARLAGHPSFWVVLVLVLFGVPLGRALLRPAAVPPPVLIEVPAFQLQDEAGAPFGSAELTGRVYIASFLFTTCGQVCPKLAATVARLQPKLAPAGGAALLVSFSVDPSRDTPERLREYGRAHGAKPHLWKFLTGSMPAVEQAVIGGFKQPMNRVPLNAHGAADSGFFDIVHSERLVLVDGKGRIRGFYEAKEDSEQGLSQLLRDTFLVLNERPTAAHQVATGAIHP